MISNVFFSVSCNRLFLKITWIWIILIQISCIALSLVKGQHEFDLREISLWLGLVFFFLKLLVAVIINWGLVELVLAIIAKSKVGVISAVAGIVCAVVVFVTFTPSDSVGALPILGRIFFVDTVLAIVIAAFSRKVGTDSGRTLIAADN